MNFDALRKNHLLPSLFLIPSLDFVKPSVDLVKLSQMIIPQPNKL